MTDDRKLMRTGTAQTDITPPVGIPMSGFVARTQPSVCVHDPLFARALFLEQDGRRLLWLHADLIAFERADVWALKRRLFDLYGLHPHEVMVTATHTHSGPATLRLLECGEYAVEYVGALLGTLADLAGAAIRSAAEAAPVFAEGICTVGNDRRGFPPGHTDHRVPVVAWLRADGTYAAVLASCAVHGVAMGHNNRQISADILGHAARMLSDRLPGEPVVLFANGPCGNMNPPGEGTDFGPMEGWGTEVAESALKALGSAIPAPDTVGPGRLATLVAAPGRLSEAEIDATVAGALAGNERFLSAKARWRAGLLSEDPATRERVQAPIDVQVVKLAGVIFAGFGGELFSHAADALGPDVYPVSYANGSAGYICPAPIYREGGYEPHVACLFYGTNPLPEDTFERATNLARDLIAEMAAN